MKTINFSKEFFNIKDTLECGQIFRFKPYKEGYLVFTVDKCAYVYETNDGTVVECEDADADYFWQYFDLDRDYRKIYDGALSQSIEILTLSATLGKGVRILNQDREEMLFSFIVSQNNNIPRIKGIIERLCAALGQRRTFDGQEYYAFPTVEEMASQGLEFYKSVGLGYRAEYVRRLAVTIRDGLDISSFCELPTKRLNARLISLHGVGRKVADCVSLFGFHRGDAFPVDTWTEKVYLENFDGTLTDREKIADWFVDKFGENAGFYQQYLFYYKRSLENKK